MGPGLDLYNIFNDSFLLLEPSFLFVNGHFILKSINNMVLLRKNENSWINILFKKKLNININVEKWKNLIN